MNASELLFLLACFRAVAVGGRDGGWGEWSEWTPCTATCGSGFHLRFRLCNDPPPSDGGKDCQGFFRDRERCDDLKACPVDGGWTNWGFWTECSKTCGPGVRQRQRTCTQPIPQAGGKDCDGAPEQRETCTINQNCPRDGQWSRWSFWSPCSVTCGEGTRQRFRECNDPFPSGGGKPCTGLGNEIDDCFAGVECPVDGGWTNWGLWTECSKTCGPGVRQRQRTCTQPIPQAGGKDCDGAPEESQTCTVKKTCRRNGQWSWWSGWSPCSETCGEGTRQRLRECNNPPPSGGGKPCRGLDNEIDGCFAGVECPVNGQWSTWTGWSRCPVTCGTAPIQRSRKCDDPPPQFGGLDCTGDSTETKLCDIGIPCPVNGQWSLWSGWGPCSSPNCRTKKDSVQYRMRSCNNPVPAHDGLMCHGDFLNAGVCRIPVNCPIDGKWSEWTEWTCEDDMAKRTRQCDSPPPTNGGKPCPDGQEIEFRSREEHLELFRQVCGNVPDDYEDEEEFDEGV